jgi:6-phosphogluconolactonase
MVGPYGIDAWDVLIDPTGARVYATRVSLGKMYGYTIDQVTGALTSVNGNTGYVNGSGSSMIISDPNINYIYSVGYGGSAMIGAYKANLISGALTPPPTQSVASPAAFTSDATVDPTGKFLYIADTPANLIYAFQINADASFTVSVPATYPGGGAFKISPNGKMLVTTGTNGIYQYWLNSGTGALTAVAGSPVAPPSSVSGGMFTPDSKFFFGFGADVLDYNLDGSTGALSPNSTYFGTNGGPNAFFAIPQ